MTTYDVIIIGGGAMGSAAAYHLAKRGVKALLIEQFEIDHTQGSSYGNSRIIRYTYKDPEYIQLAKEVYPLWRQLEAEAGETLWHVTGGIDFGHTDEPSLVDTIQYVKAANIPYEMLTPEETNRRFKQFNLPEHFAVLYQPESGMLSASKVVLAQTRLAQQHGATVTANNRVQRITVLPDAVTVETSQGTYSAARLILTAGSWTNEALAMMNGEPLRLPLQPLRCQEQHFNPADGYAMQDYTVGHMPLYIYHYNMVGGQSIYGIPSHDGAGVKSSVYGGVNVDHPRDVDRNPDWDMVEWVQRETKAWLPAVGHGTLKEARACLYTMTPDTHFIMDKHPQYANVVIGAGFSGHGFKFSNGIGKILSELSIDGATPHQIDLWRLARFSA